MANMKEFFNKEIENFSKTVLKLQEKTEIIEKITQLCIDTIKNGNKIMICGNGGSAADSQHFATELIGRYKKNRKAIPAIALTTNSSNLTAIGNDFGFEKIFERQVEGLGKPGDLLIGISTSGNSQNIINAFIKAKEMGIKTAALTGISGGSLKDYAEILLNVPSEKTNNIQEMHIIIEHMICEAIEEDL